MSVIADKVRIAVQNALSQVEAEYDVRVLLAVESGSRAWGFASTDSDWDVRFIYVHRPEWYLSIDDKRDVIEKMLPLDIDLAGWELKKALRLFRKSNPPLLEWLRSPLVYKESFSTAAAFRQIDSGFFSPLSVAHHYLSMGKRNHAHYLTGPDVRLKKYFYVLRPLMACDWIHQTNSMAPMEFKHLLNRVVPSGELRSAIDRLLAQKMSGVEMGVSAPVPIIHDWVEQRLAYYEQTPPQLKSTSHADTKDLDQLFRDTLKEVWG